LEASSLREVFRALSKRYALEILSCIVDRDKNITEISDETGIPYTSVQQTVSMLERVGLVRTVYDRDPSSKRPVRRVFINNFMIIVTPETIRKAVVKSFCVQGS